MSYRQDLLKSYQMGNFLETIYASLSADRNERSAVASELVALHNEGLINVVAGFEHLKNKMPSGPDFFLTRYVFEEVMPDIDAPVLAVMRCVLHLYREAGQDGAAGTIIGGFVDFCTKQSYRPQEALVEIEKSPNELGDLLAATIAAGARIDRVYYLDQAIRLSKDESIELRRRAVFSIGSIDWSKGIDVPDSVIATLEHITTIETDDRMLANVVKTSFTLLQCDKSHEARIVSLVTTAVTKGDELTLHAASEIFGFNTAELPVSLLEMLFVQFVRIKPSNKGTWNNVDYGITHLLKSDDAEQATQFLEGLLLAYPDSLTMDFFNHTSRVILSKRALINKILTRWFLRGDRVLCIGIQTIISTYHGDDLSLEIDPAELKSADFVHSLFIARKAIGYLFMQPISAASVLISLMRYTTDDEVLEGIGELLFDPLILNFTGKAREFVMQQSMIESGKVKDILDQALKAIDDYLDDLQSVGKLAALHPGEAQREAYRRHFTSLMTESFKAAEAQSVFLNLVSKSVLLYGRKSISYTYSPDGQSHRMEIPLQSHGTEMEFPRMENLDPFGLDYMLRIFRNEQFRV